MGFFDKIREKLVKTKDNIGNKINEVFSGFKKVDEELLESLEEILIMADLGMDTVSIIISTLRENIKKKSIEEPDKVKEELKNIIVEMIDIEKKEDNSKKCILVIGVNGAGKTTTIGKMAKGYIDEGKKVLLVPADTFRAAAGEQIKMWAERAGVDITEIRENADPSAVVYSSLEYANQRNYDIIIIDTAGRLHNKKNLMEELKKINRSVDKLLKADYTKETLLVLDGTTGQNAIEQAKAFSEVTDIDGYVLTKLDGTSKGGVIIGIVNRTKFPIKYIGIGEKITDLQKFNAKEFVDAIFE
jgi:signal recognition particle-docking protein ftsY